MNLLECEVVWRTEGGSHGDRVDCRASVLYKGPSEQLFVRYDMRFGSLRYMQLSLLATVFEQVVRSIFHLY